MQTCNDFCQVEKYPTVFWKGVFKDAFENQTLERLLA